MIGFTLASLEKTWYNLQLAFRSLWLHKLRAFLSVLGIIIGTGAVISLMSFGEGSMQEALDAIKRLGATNIMIRSVKPIEESATSGDSFFVTYGLTEEDYKRFRNISTVVKHVPLRVFSQEIYRGAIKQTGRLVGTTARYSEVHQFKMAMGRFLNEADSEESRNHAVLGKSLANKLFPAESPLGKTVTIRQYMYVVVGVIADRMPTGGAGGSLAFDNYNDDMYIPLKTCNNRFGERVYMRTAGSRTGEEVQLHQITLTVDRMENVKQTAEIVRRLLGKYHGDTNDWQLTVPLDRLEAAEETKRNYQKLLFMIASISLLVGGIGIMNIMLATVTERTREIGIRRALGAKRGDITMQFLIEATAQTSIGGIVGVMAGVGVVTLVPPAWEFLFGNPVPAILHVPSIFLGFGAAVFVGVVSGLYPAIRAAKMDPVEALRHV